MPDAEPLTGERPKPRIDVVIPAYRAETTIARAIASVTAQAGVDARVIVVVDGIHDDTAARARACSGPVTVVVNAENMGGQYSRNRGLALAEAPYVMFLDSDDFIDGPLLAGLCAAIGDTADFGVGPWQVWREADGTHGPLVTPDYASPSDMFHRWLARTEFVPPCAIVWRTDFVREIGGWEPSLRRNQDGELVMRALIQGGRFVCSTQGRGVYVHASKATSITARADNLGNMLDAPALLLAMSQAHFEPDFVGRTLAQHYYNVAEYCFQRGDFDTGGEALQRMRRLKHPVVARGSRRHRLLVSLIGLSNRYRLRRFRARLSRRPG